MIPLAAVMPQAAAGSRQAEARHIVVGTAGHIDHGKTALVYALTGTDTDRLPEEKQRGITIDLGFAALQLKDPAGNPLLLSIVDVPGHHAFIRNMLAGTGGIDCVMLVIAADEGVKAQTAEHLAICSLLGIQRGVVVLSKCDAVSEEQMERTRQNVGLFVAGTFLQGAPVLGASAFTGAGLDAVRSALGELASTAPARSAERVLRLPLDRSFSVRGFGTVVTGTLQAGTVRTGDMLQQIPAGRMVRVRGVQMHGSNCEAAVAPCRAALNLGGVEVAEVGRGHTLIAPNTLNAVRTVDVELEMLPDAPALKHGSTLRAHAFTSDSPARVLLFDQKDTREHGSQLARLQLARPMLLVPGDRIVLRRCSPAMTVGGARVLDAAPQPRVRKPMELGFLQRLSRADDAERLRLRVGRRGAKGISIADLVVETGWKATALRDRLAGLTREGTVLECAAHDGAAGHWIAAGALAEVAHQAEQEVARSGSLARAELRTRMGLNAAVFGAVLQRLAASGKYELQGDVLRKAGAGDGIPEAKRRQLQLVEAIYARQGLAAPAVHEIGSQLGIDATGMRELITWLLRGKRLVRMGGDDAFVHAGALEELYAKLRRCKGEKFDVGRFKSFTGLTRKHAIPLLEHLDQARITRNSQGVRIVL